MRMLKGLGNMASMLKQAHALRGQVAEMQERLARARVQGSAGGGMVMVEANGQQNILGVRIDPSVLDDKEMLEDLLVAATNQALEKSREAAAREMEQVTGNFNVPGLGEALAKMGLGDSVAE
jgi:DNA-binding YbaB/EbfC family protein